MKKRQLTAILLIAAITLTLTLAACSGDNGPNTYNPAPDMTTDTGAQENRTAAVDETIVPPNTGEMRINTEFLEEFGMTLSELEEKYGLAKRGEVDDSLSKVEALYRTTYTYFFEGNNRGYNFWIEGEDENEVNEQRSSTDGVARVNDVNRRGERIEFHWFSGQVSDLIIGLEATITYRELKNFFDVETPGSHFTFAVNNDLFGVGIGVINERGVRIWLNDDDLVSLDSYLSMRYYPEGRGFY
jgi:predicted small lipoprotein YifL